MSAKTKLLIIDDERTICNLIKLHFETEGYLVYTAFDVQEGKKMLANKPDLILLDINMPDENGIDFCRGIREYIDCPIFFLTSKVTEQDKVLGHFNQEISVLYQYFFAHNFCGFIVCSFNLVFFTIYAVPGM